MPGASHAIPPPGRASALITLLFLRWFRCRAAIGRSGRGRGFLPCVRRDVLHFSLAGVQLKFSAIGPSGKQLRIPAQGRDGQWIVKLPSPKFPSLPENEFAMMTLAKEAGIDVPEFGLISVGSIANIPAEFSED